jgi:hypothetical protein
MRFHLYTVAVLSFATVVPMTPAAGANDEVLHLPTLQVSGERFEEFGFRVSSAFDPIRSSAHRKIYSPVVDLVLPNTAASKAGLRPGDRILRAGGVPTLATSDSLRQWEHLQKAQWRNIADGNSTVNWRLEVESAGTYEPRAVSLQLPTPAPHWGAANWRPPEGRTPVVLTETGPLAERAGQILNNGIWMILRRWYVVGFGLPIDSAHPHFLCYQWTIWEKGTGHRMYVSRQRGRTDIVLEVIYHSDPSFSDSSVPVKVADRSLASAATALGNDASAFLTSPSGELQKAWRIPRFRAPQELPLESARPSFAAEVEFWTTRVTPAPGMWPFGLK